MGNGSARAAQIRAEFSARALETPTCIGYSPGPRLGSHYGETLLHSRIIYGPCVALAGGLVRGFNMCNNQGEVDRARVGCDIADPQDPQSRRNL